MKRKELEAVHAPIDIPLPEQTLAGVSVTDGSMRDNP